MGLFNDIFNNNKTEEELLEEKKAKSSKLLDEKLDSMSFTKLEKREIFELIEVADANIDILRRDLINTTVNSKNSEEITNRIRKEMLEIQTQMAEDIKIKINEIQTRKINFKKESE